MSGGLPAVSRQLPLDRLSNYIAIPYQAVTIPEYLDVFDIARLAIVNRVCLRMLSDYCFKEGRILHKYREDARAVIKGIDADHRYLNDLKSGVEQSLHRTQRDLEQIQSAISGKVVKYLSACRNRIIVTIIKIFRDIFSCIDNAFKIQEGLSYLISTDQGLIKRYGDQLNDNRASRDVQQKVINYYRSNTLTHLRAWDSILSCIGGLKKLNTCFVDLGTIPRSEVSAKPDEEINTVILKMTSNHCLVKSVLESQVKDIFILESQGKRHVVTEFLTVRIDVERKGLQVQCHQIFQMTHEINERTGSVKYHNWRSRGEFGRMDSGDGMPQIALRGFFKRAIAYLESWKKTNPGKTLKAVPELATVQPCPLLNALGVKEFLSLPFIEISPGMLSELRKRDGWPDYISWSEECLNVRKKNIDLMKRIDMQSKMIKERESLYSKSLLDDLRFEIKLLWNRIEARDNIDRNLDLKVWQAPLDSTIFTPLENYQLMRGILDFNHCIVIAKTESNVKENQRSPFDSSPVKIVYVAVLDGLPTKEASEKELLPSDHQYARNGVDHYYPMGDTGHERLFRLIQELKDYLSRSNRTLANAGALPKFFVEQLTLL